MKIDAKAIKNLTNKKILDVFGEAEFTRLEKIFIFVTLINLALCAVNLILNGIVISKLGMLNF